MSIDFNILKAEIKTAVKEAFTAINAQHKDGDVYSFALYSDEGALTVCPSANTKTHLAEMISDDPDDAHYYKFEPAEWQYESVGAEKRFSAISRQLFETNKAGYDGSWSAFQKQLYETCISALEELRAEGFFEPSIFLLFTVSDTDQSPKQANAIVKRLNNNAYAEEYRLWTKSWDD